MTKRKFKCQILTQDIGEWASLFAGRVEETVNEIMEDPQVLGSPMCFPTSDSSGRKEVLIQWLVEVKEEEKGKKKVLKNYLL